MFTKLKQTSTLLTVLGIGLIVPGLVLANTVVRTGESVAVEDNQVVEGDFYALGSLVSVSGEVTDDLIAIAGRVKVNGEIGADVLAFAGSVDLHASVTDDVRVVAGDVTIAEHIEGDVVVIAGTLQVLSSASIDGDVLFFGGDAEISGAVGGSVMGQFGTLRIDAAVGKDVDVSAGTLTLGEQAEVAGDVRLTSSRDLVRAQGATIGGEVTKSDVVARENDVRTTLRSVLIPFLISLFAALSLHLLFRRQIETVVLSAKDAPGLSILIGAITLLVGLVGAILLMVTVVGVFVGLMTLFAYFLGTILSLVLGQIILGSLTYRLFTNTTIVTPVTIVLGVAVFHVFTLVPFIGGWAIFFTIAIAFGAVIRLLYKHTR